MDQIKKNILWIVLALVVAVGGWGLYAFFGPKQAIEDVIPSGAIAYVRLANAVKHLQNGAQTDFYKNISSIDLPKVLAFNKVPASKIKEITQWQSQAFSFLKNPMTKKFLGQELALSVYHNPELASAQNSNDPYGFLVIARLPPAMQAAEFASNFASQFGEDIETSDERYNGRRIVQVHLKNKDIRLKYVRINDLVLISSEDESQLKAAIDVHMHKRPALNEDSSFIFAKSKSYPNAQGMAFINVLAFNNILKDQMKSLQEQDPDKSDDGQDPFGQTTGFQTYAFSFLPGEILKYKLAVGFEPQSVKPPLRRLLSCVPGENLSLGLVPPHAIGYQWSGCYDFQGSWQQAQEQMHAVPQVQEQASRIKSSIEKRFGFNIEQDLLPVLGQEAGGYMTDIDTRGMFPYPRLLTFIKINDRQKVQDILGKIVKSPLGMLQEEEYNQVNIRYLPLPLGANMDPGYCFVGDYLLASTTRQLLKRSIDIYKDPARSIKSDKTFNAFELNKGNNQSVLFLKTGELAKLIRDLLDWGNKYFSSQVSMAGTYKQDAQEKKQEIARESAARNAEIKMALGKIKQLKEKKIDPASDEATVNAQALASIERDVQTLRDELKTYSAQQKELDEAVVNYDLQAEAAKLFMYNAQHVFVPFLKGVESIHAQGFKVFINDKSIETELMSSGLMVLPK